MKKIFFAFALVLLLTPALSLAQLDNNLYYGLQSNSEVKQLQEFLTEQGIYSGPITGNFYSLTLSAVKSYQQKENISPVSGYVGTLTRTSINNKLSNNLQGSNQESLNETGTNLPVATPSANTNDVVATLQAQIALLMQQLQTMQSQQTSVQQLQQTVQQQTQTIQQIQQNTQQIAQNTTPVTITTLCVPNWKCETWKDGSYTDVEKIGGYKWEGNQYCFSKSRTCSDTNNCNVETGKPETFYKQCWTSGEISIINIFNNEVVKTGYKEIGKFELSYTGGQPVNLNLVSVKISPEIIPYISNLRVNGLDTGVVKPSVYEINNWAINQSLPSLGEKYIGIEAIISEDAIGKSGSISLMIDGIETITAKSVSTGYVQGQTITFIPE